ncbi:unnamed protein product [Ostreobium quekettii]|uniref:PPM-type phosphatase domain-containing protein n=1 Tax=Ostreobium quekettii TaxID=121088 RepID=A0A8S1J543_9CHLO|nr:unnamed protein product [Ostreobium quekettii]
MGRPPRGRGDGAPGGEPGGRGGGGMPGHAEVDCDLWEDRCAPSVKYSFSQQQTKGQDVVFVQEGLTRREDGPTWSVYCACDGHAGVAAARFVRDRLWEALGPLLPTRRMPLYKTDGFKNFALEVRLAVVKAFVAVGQRFKADLPNDASGTTATLALLCGRLLTVANVGDTDAVLDLGTDAFLATTNHKIASSDAEYARLAKAGVEIAALAPSLTQPAKPGESSVGPIRCWPGGLTVARSVGDIEAGAHIISSPHVLQVSLPRSGARLLMGTGGLWDLIHWEEAAQMARRALTEDAAQRVMNLAMLQNNWSIRLDTSILVIDVLPGDRGDFPKLVKAKMRRRQAAGGEQACDCDLRQCLLRRSSKKGRENLGMNCDDYEVVSRTDGADAVSPPPNDSCSSFPDLLSRSEGVEHKKVQAKARCGKAAGYSQGRRSSAGSSIDKRLAPVSMRRSSAARTSAAAQAKPYISCPSIRSPGRSLEKSPRKSGSSPKYCQTCGKRNSGSMDCLKNMRSPRCACAANVMPLMVNSDPGHQMGQNARPQQPVGNRQPWENIAELHGGNSVRQARNPGCVSVRGNRKSWVRENSDGQSHVQAVSAPLTEAHGNLVNFLMNSTQSEGQLSTRAAGGDDQMHGRREAFEISMSQGQSDRQTGAFSDSCASDSSGNLVRARRDEDGRRQGTLESQTRRLHERTQGGRCISGPSLQSVVEEDHRRFGEASEVPAVLAPNERWPAGHNQGQGLDGDRRNGSRGRRRWGSGKFV